MVRSFRLLAAAWLILIAGISSCGGPDKTARRPNVPEPATPEMPPARADLVDSLQHVDPGAALEHLNSLIAADSEKFELYYEKGLVLEQLRDTPRAIAAFRKAWAAEPAITYAIELAHLLAEKKDPASLALCDTIQRMDSARELTDPFFIRGIFYSNTAQYPKATQQFDSCIARDWKFPDAYLEKGIAEYKMKDFDRALKTFHTASFVAQAEADPYYWMGRCLEATGKKAEARDNYAQAVALDPGFAEAVAALKRLSG